MDLFKASWAVIRQDRELLALPVISAIASLATIALFAIPVLALTDFSGASASGSVETGPFTYVVLAVAYLVLAFITIFFNSAIVHAANERMSGGDPTVGSALAGASGRIGRILPWAIVSATVSYTIRQLQERAGIFGAIFGFLGGLAWSAVTFLVLPILVIEDIGVVDAVKRSAALLRNAWGEGLAGNVGMGIIGFIAMVPFLAIGALGLMSGTAAVMVPTLSLAVIGIIAITVVMSALSIVYQTALYRFATSQPVPAFSSATMEAAFRRR
jgi:hypothetical protein